MDAPTLAAVDIGTNSVKMTIGRGETILWDGVRVTRLGEGVDASGALLPAAVARTLDALTEFGRIAREHGADRLHAVGTSAMRDAADRENLVASAAAALGGTVEVISGEREAHLVYVAARRDPLLAVPDGAFLVATDVGGGSSEVVVGDAGGILSRRSLQIGAVRLTERAGLGGAATIDSLDLTEAILQAEAALEGLEAPPGPCAMVASGGTAANLAGMERGALDPAAIHAMLLPVERIRQRAVALASMPLEERRRVPGLEPARADVIVAGALIQAALAEHFGCAEVRVSARGLRYGLLFTMRDGG